MARQEKDEWKKAYANAFVEPDPKKQIEICDRARQLIQEQMVNRAAAGDLPDETLEEALREIWKLQERTRKSLNLKGPSDIDPTGKK